jgi:hypothetical protein
MAANTVRVEYFKASGKYYAEAAYDSDHADLWDVVKEFKERCRRGDIPGLSGKKLHFTAIVRDKSDVPILIRPDDEWHRLSLLSAEKLLHEIALSNGSKLDLDLHQVHVLETLAYHLSDLSELIENYKALAQQATDAYGSLESVVKNIDSVELQRVLTERPEHEAQKVSEADEAETIDPISRIRRLSAERQDD